MDTSDLPEITRLLTEFAGARFSDQVLPVQGPIREGSTYIWRIISNRFREVTVVVKTNKSLFGKTALTSLEVYGLGESKTSKPDLKELQAFLATAELTAVR